MLRLGWTDGPGAEVGPALQQSLSVAFHCDSPLPPHGNCIRTGQQPFPVTPMEQASTGMATPKRLNQIASMAVSRRIALTNPPRFGCMTLNSRASSVNRHQSHLSIGDPAYARKSVLDRDAWHVDPGPLEGFARGNARRPRPSQPAGARTDRRSTSSSLHSRRFT
jgi:hypothetical protein